MSPVKLGFVEPDNAIAYALFQALIKQGVSPDSMDMGYTKANYLGRICPNTSERSCRIGANDGVLAPQEIMDYALEAAESSESMRKLVEGVLHRPIPWALDDLDPKTPEDAVLRAKLAEVTQALRDILARKGLQKDSPEYQERLALGLYYFALMPGKKEIDTMGKINSFMLAQGLEDVGLFEWAQYLVQNGGWGILDENEKEYTALESLKFRKGKCTERAKILYAVLRNAGIPAQFVYVNPARTKDAEFRKSWGEDPTQHHVCIAIPTSAGLRLLDTTKLQAASLYREYYPFSKREFWVFDLNNRAGRLMDKAVASALDVFNTANSMDPQSPLILYGRAWALANTGKIPEALASFSSAYKLYPLVEMDVIRAMIFARTGDFEKGLEILDRATARFPKWDGPYLIKASIYTAQEKLDESEKIYSKLIDRLPKNAMPGLIAQYHFERGKVRYSNGNYEEAAKDMIITIKKQPDFIGASILLADIYHLKTGETPKARAIYDDLIARGKQTWVVYIKLAQIWLSEQKWQKTIENCEKAMGFPEKGPAVYSIRGQARLGQMEIPAARQDMLRFISLSPNDGSATEDATKQRVEEILKHVWNEPQWQAQGNEFEFATGVKIYEFQKEFFMAGLFWEQGRREKAIDSLNSFISRHDSADFRLRDAQPLVRQVLSDLPKSMMQDPKVAELLKPIQ